ncbi:MAG: phosphoribosylformylglycinamidine synthase subunit PurQ [Eggerthellaceae bacterium]
MLWMWLRDRSTKQRPQFHSWIRRSRRLSSRCVGNGIGLKLDENLSADALFDLNYGAFVVELADSAELPEDGELLSVTEIGQTTEAYEFVAADETLNLAELQEAWEGAIEPVFPYRSTDEDRAAAPKVEPVTYTDALPLTYCGSIAKPRVIIPVFPGTNCEFDTAHAFERAGAKAQTLVINNLTPAAVAESTKALVEAIKNSRSSCCLAASPAATSLTAPRSSLPRSSAPPRSPRPCATCCRTATA